MKRYMEKTNHAKEYLRLIEARSKAWNRSFPGTFRESLVLLTS